MKSTAAVSALAALAQESRLAIFRILVQAGPAGLSAGKIAEASGVQPSALSFHMKELSFAGLATSRSEGRFVIYTANFKTMSKLLVFLTENCCADNPCMPVSNTVCSPICLTEENQ